MENHSLSLFNQVADVADEVFFTFDVQANRLKFLGAAFERIWEIPVNDVLQNPHLIINTIHQDDRGYAMDCFSKSKHSSKANRFEFRILCPHDVTKYILVRTFPNLNDGETTVLGGMAGDISVLKRNLLYSEKINARKDTMLHILAHDLKGPISIVNMVASSIGSDAKAAGNEGVLQSVKVIQDMCNSNIALIRSLLDNEFLESPEVDLRKERVELVWGIKDLINNYNRASALLSKNFVVTSNSEAIYADVDALKLMQVFNNLITNAVKFTQADGVIKVNIQEKPATILVSVSDNGIGIPADLQPYLFDKFTRARRAGLHGEETVGLGMSIIKNIVELHGGKIWFESIENQGSTFYIELPK